MRESANGVVLDDSCTNTGSNLESEMQRNLDMAIEIKSQVAELRDYLIGQRSVGGIASVHHDPEGLFGRMAKINSEQSEALGDISDLILEIRNHL